MKFNPRPRLHLLLAVFALTFASLASVPVRAADAVTLTATAVAKKGSPPPIKKEDIQVFEGKERVQATDWRHGENLYLAILIDDSIDSEAASQWSDLKTFIAAQPQNAFVAVDYSRGGFDPLDPDLDTTIEHAQKNNINVWSIYYPGGGHLGRGYFRVFNAQANLSKLSEETGAESYYMSFERPVSLKPYFDEIQEHLNNQYLLTFQTSGGGKKGKFERIRVTTEVPNV